MSDASKWTFLPWMIIAIGGTASFARIEQIQCELRQQQSEIASHQQSLTEQVAINEHLRSERSQAISAAILRQCVENYRIDGKLAKLGMDLFAAPSLDKKAKDALADFSSEVAQNQGELQCSNPLPERLKKDRSTSR
jgi:hypothetical protein